MFQRNSYKAKLITFAAGVLAFGLVGCANRNSSAGLNDDRQRSPDALNTKLTGSAAPKPPSGAPGAGNSNPGPTDVRSAPNGNPAAGSGDGADKSRQP